MDIHEFLAKRGACNDAIKWAQGKTAQEMYDDCERADWLLWMYVRATDFQKDEVLRLYVLTKAMMANLVLPWMDNDNSINATVVARAYGEGVVSLEELDLAHSLTRWYGPEAEHCYRVGEYANSRALRANSIGRLVSMTMEYEAGGYAIDLQWVAKANAAMLDKSIGKERYDMMKACADIFRQHVKIEHFTKITF